MALSRLAREFAAEIAGHDWSDAPYRADRAGHRREHDKGWESKPRLDDKQTEIVQLNVAWVVGQTLGHAGLLRVADIYEFVEACGVNVRTSSGKLDGSIRHGFRITDDAFDPPVTVQRLASVGLDDMDEWDEVDFSSPVLIPYPLATDVVNSWLNALGVKKRYETFSFAAYAKKYIDDATAEAVPAGELRRWFRAYYSQNFVVRNWSEDEPIF